MLLYSGVNNTRTAGYLAENLLDPATAFSQEPNEAAFQRAHRTTLTSFEFMDLPENADLLKKFGIAMRATTSFSDHAVVSNGESIRAGSERITTGSFAIGFDWRSLPQGSLVVDVGGGVGNLTMSLAKVYKHLRYVVQDRPGTAKEGEAVGTSFISMLLCRTDLYQALEEDHARLY